MWAVKNFLPKLIYFFLIFYINKLVILLLLTLDVWCCLLCAQQSTTLTWSLSRTELLCSRTLLLDGSRSSYRFRTPVSLSHCYFLLYMTNILQIKLLKQKRIIIPLTHFSWEKHKKKPGKRKEEEDQMFTFWE